MTLLIQNDEGTIAGANSYVSVQEFKDYWSARGVDYASSTDEEIEAILIPALSYLDVRYEYCGYKLNGYEQSTEFPRGDLYYCGGRYEELVEGIPQSIKDAQCEYGNIQNENGTLQPNESTTGAIKKEKKGIGPLSKEIEYCGCGSSGGIISYPNADNKIPKDFICNYGQDLDHA